MSRELIVVGAGQGGLSAAIEARLLGWNVLVLEQSGQVGGKAGGIEIEGFALDPGPSIIILLDIYRQTFQAAGRKMEDYLRFSRLDPFTRVCLEGKKPLDLPAGKEECLRALGEAAPEDREGLRTLLGRLETAGPLWMDVIFRKPIHNFWQLMHPKLIRGALPFDVRKTYRQIVDDHIRSDLLRAFFYGFPSYSGQTYSAKSAAGLLIPYLMIESGVWTVEGGVAAIPNAYRRLAEELGVEFRFHAKVTGLQVQSGRVKGVTLEGGEAIPADAVICNRDRISVSSWLGRPEPKRTSFSYCTQHWGIRKEMPGLLHHTLLIPADYQDGFHRLYEQRQAPLEPILYVNSTPAPPGCSCLFAVATVPALEDHIEWEAESERLAVSARRQLERFGFGFRDDEVIFERRQDPRYFLNQHGSWRGSLYGADESERLWGMLPLRVQDEELSNLLYVGGAVQPGAGLPMVTLGGRFAAELLPDA